MGSTFVKHAKTSIHSVSLKKSKNEGNIYSPDSTSYYYAGVPKGYFVTPGMQCPYFTGKGLMHGKIEHFTKSSFTGRYLVILFHPGAYIDTSILLAFKEHCTDFQQEECEVLAISCRDEATQVSWLRATEEEGGLSDPKIHFLFDINGEVCNQFGTLRQLREETWQSRRRKLQPEGENVGEDIEEHVIEDKDMLCMRSVVIVDDKGIIQHASFYGDSICPAVEDILRLVQAFKHVNAFNGELCPALWNKGEQGIQASMPPSEEEIWESLFQNLDKEKKDELLEYYDSSE